MKKNNAWNIRRLVDVFPPIEPVTQHKYYDEDCLIFTLSQLGLLKLVRYICRILFLATVLPAIFFLV